jgi:hypothetical protein
MAKRNAQSINSTVACGGREDVDLIARDWEDMGGPCEESLLNKLLNEMDGLAENAPAREQHVVEEQQRLSSHPRDSLR